MPGAALIVEDHPLYRDALTQVLIGTFDAGSIFTAPSAEEGLRLAKDRADLRLILLDPGLPGLSGVEAISGFHSSLPNASIVVVSASEDRRQAAGAFRAGASAFVSKAVPADTLSEVIQRVLSGRSTRGMWVLPTGEYAAPEDPALQFTPRQRDILSLLCEGHSNKEIGLRLSLAEVTVKMHVSSIFTVLQVANRTQAVLAARRLGLQLSQ